MNKLDLMQKAFASLASIGDVYTDAPECAASVAAAENLAVLARYLAGESEVVAQGVLRADGQNVSNVSVRADGSLILATPEEPEADADNWTLALPDGQEFRVAMFKDDTEDNVTWVVDQADGFYAALLRQ